MVAPVAALSPGPTLPDFDTADSPSTAELEQHVSELLSAQLLLARSICSESPFASILRQRLTILQRMFHAIASKHHDKDKVSFSQSASRLGLISVSVLGSNPHNGTGDGGYWCRADGMPQ